MFAFAHATTICPVRMDRGADVRVEAQVGTKPGNRPGVIEGK